MTEWDELTTADIVAVDCETSGLHPDDGARVSCVACAWKGGSIALPFDQGCLDKLTDKKMIEGQTTIEWKEETANLSVDEWRRLLGLLRTKRLVMHNAAFDLIMLAAGTRHWPGVDLGDALEWDTMLAHRVWKPKARAGLDMAAQEMGVGKKYEQDAVKEWLKKTKQPKGRYDLPPWDVIKGYVRADAEITLALYEEQKRHITEEEKDAVLRECKREFDLAVTLMRVEQRGVRFDVEKSLAAAVVMEHKVEEIEAQLPFRMTPAGARKYFVDEMGLPTARDTKSGAPSCDAEQIRDWVDDGVQWAAEYRDATKAKRAASMWYRGYAEKVGEDGRLRCRYRQTKSHEGGDTGARSGRLSAERVNLQAMPKADRIEKGMVGVRDLLLARNGCVLVSLDMSQAELRAAARYSKCEKMLQMLSEGVDFHGKTTEDVMWIERSHPEWKLKRDIGKKLTFGAIFGIGGEGFQKLLTRETGIFLELKECNDLVWKWRATYPEIMDAYRKAEYVFKNRGYVRLLPGTPYEKRSYKELGDLSQTGWNRMVQGSLAAWLRLWLVEIDHEWPGTIVQTVHDSVVLELPVKTARATAKKVIKKSSERASELFDVAMPIEMEIYQ